MDDARPNRPRAGPRDPFSSDGGRTALDRVLKGLTRRYDRYVLYHLIENEPAEFDELVDAVVALETGRSAAAAPDGVREEIRAELHHTVLPKLQHLGIVEYDRRSDAIRYQNPPSYLEEFLHLVRELDGV